MMVIKEFVRDHIPLEQGLRLADSLAELHRPLVRDHIPLEQGLRLTLATLMSPISSVSETIFH